MAVRTAQSRQSPSPPSWHQNDGVIGIGNTGVCPSPAVGKTTQYAYDYANYQAQAPDGLGNTRLDQYGNVTKISEYAEAPAGQVGALLRTTERWYDTINDFAVGGTSSSAPGRRRSATGRATSWRSPPCSTTATPRPASWSGIRAT